AGGALKVTGLVLPERAGSVRRRVALVDLAADVAALPGDAPAPAAHRVPAAAAVDAVLRESPRLLVVVGTDAVTAPAERGALAASLARAVGGGTAVVLGAVGPAPTDLAPPGTPVLDLHDPDPAHTVPAAPVVGPRTEEVPACASSRPSRRRPSPPSRRHPRRARAASTRAARGPWPPPSSCRSPCSGCCWGRCGTRRSASTPCRPRSSTSTSPSRSTARPCRSGASSPRGSSAAGPRPRTPARSRCRPPRGHAT